MERSIWSNSKRVRQARPPLFRAGFLAGVSGLPHATCAHRWREAEDQHFHCPVLSRDDDQGAEVRRGDQVWHAPGAVEGRPGAEGACPVILPLRHARCFGAKIGRGAAG
ncbi:MAG: hypothetical protein RDU59_12280 [Thermodesulfobacteriota bacterium]|nr:hypothetical protein [Thermodesulfobacteriota bacterium]